MIVLSEQKLALLFEEIAKGFVHSPQEISIFIILVLSFFSMFLFANRYQVKKSITEKTRRAQDTYERIIKKTPFSLSELRMLYHLAKYLKTPQEKNLLLEKQSTFNTCVRKLRNKQRISAPIIAGLRLKLGFKRQDPEQIPLSSADLSTNLPVIIVQKGGKQTPGKILKFVPGSLIIGIENGCPPPASSSHIQVYFQKCSGIFSISTFVQKSGNGVIRAAHSDNIKRLQRRKFYRKKIRLPVYVKPSDSHEPAVLTTFIDLGGGGASLNNRGRQFHERDDIKLSFFTSRDARITLTAVVTRVSEGGKTLHVAFVHIPESSRDRIMGYLFRRKSIRQKPEFLFKV